MKVLAIDDNKDNLMVLKAVISEAFPEAAIFTALNGKNGIELAAATDPDVILLDIIMPEMDGFEVCKRLKHNEKLKHIPVLFLTALKTSASNRIKALEAGGDGFLSKPVNQQELIAQLRAMKKIKMAAQHQKKEKEILEAMVAERTQALEAEIKLRIETEQQLRESEERYRMISGLTSDYVFEEEVLEDGNIGQVWIAGSFKSMTGYPLSKFESANGWRDILHPDDIPVDDAAKSKLFQNQKAVFEARIRHKNGHLLWVKVNALPVWDEENNRLKKIIGSVKNITNEKMFRLQQELLLRTTQKALTEKSLPKLFAAIHQELSKVMEAHSFMVVEWDGETRTFTARYGEDEKELVTKYAAEGTLSIKVIEQKKPLFLLKKDILSLIQKGECLPVGTIPEVWMGVPLFRKENIFGLMIIQHYENPKAYDKYSLQIFEAVANELSLYIDRKEAEEKNASLSKAIHQSLIGTLITDPGGTVRFANPAFCKITGRKEEELLGKNARILIPGEDRQMNLEEEIRQSLKKGLPWKGTIFKKKRDGSPQWVDAIVSPLFDEKKRVVRIVTLLEDRTEKEQNQRFQQIQFKIAHSMVTSATLSDLFHTVKMELNKVIHAKNIFIALYDAEADTLTTQLGQDEKEFVKNIPPRKSLSGKVMQAGKPLLFTKKEIRELARRGEIILVGRRAEVWLGAPLMRKNKPMGIIAVQSYTNPHAYDEKAKEIMGIIASQLSLYIEQKRTEEFNQKLSKATEQSPVSIIITDANGTIEYVNPKFTEVTGYTRKEAIGQNPRFLKSGEHSEAFYKNIWDTILSGKEWKGELHNKRKDGTLYWENALISPIFNDAGEITHFIEVKEDITEKKKILSELIQAKEKAEESDRLKTAFLQNMSHEIRTPLNGILGFADLLTYGDITPDQTHQYARFIINSGQRLLQLINNILDISRIETGSMALHPKTFNLNRHLQDLCQPFRLEADKKGIVFSCQLPADEQESTIVSDPDKIGQIVTNLLNNALKFTAKGSIELGYRKRKTGELLFWVKDTGRGIAQEHFHRIFERFYQADISISRDFEGAGLGLPISKGLVELLGGRIWLESELGKGTTFFFTLPLQHPDKPETEQVKTGDSVRMTEKNRVVLVVEDDETSFLYLKTVLSLEKIKVLHAASGQQAVDLCRQHPEINLVLMDLKLPGMNGLDATREIKKRYPQLPVVAQTAHAFSSDRQDAIQAGCDDFIPKPTSKKTLLETVNKYLAP